MGNSSSKVGFISEPPKKHAYFSFMKVKSNKNKEFGNEFCKTKKQLHLWSERSNERSNMSETRNRHGNKCEEKFRTRFDPRITARYDIKALIGRGSFSHVVRVEHRYTHQPFAIKLLEVGKHKGQDTCHVELGILRRVHHANIIRLVEVFETPHRVYLVLELATGGELLDRVVSRGFFTERDATKALVMVSRGLSYIHALGVIHRDLKPENLLYYHPGQDSRLIITDFGLACWSRKSQMVECDVRTLCGTPEYLAPEMVAGRTYGCEVDMWALGVISYIVLSGSMPFEQRSQPRLFKAILRGNYSFHGQPWSSISNQAKDFIERLLSVKPEQRMTAEQALKHPWLLNMAACSSNKNLHRPISQNLHQRASRASNYSSSSRSVPESRSVVSSRSQSRLDSGQLARIRCQHSVAVYA
ncbi:serine/threonine-protein kinase H1 homolog [Hemibagrus wyckioides]|uniref:serine/threonine-protein kinase H1 homolog n=1 Tax=Hemibagrus wyckioides TaxID=337641 RepID=UPI00266BB61A|nr:serine/threonine-protein kinase H1 homolog [Hemibagrus wyckioides]